ncbi:metallophosphoesterase [Tessaracoccus sp. OS52]|uniref:metallophosphoesterase n=1 Tax=Tessaracoccus sp. OS52 TaxID=2886691 RepID=UPI001D126328|nr:metallophosphoesterase [Tessaracoccus sp. OS52]MCC2594583.1 metallophosphoesterase [Tessaracoccus sp. OS52]
MRGIGALTAVVALVVGIVATLVSPAGAAAPTALVVTEIAPDHAGSDHFEFFEVANTSSESVSLADYDLAYTYADASDTTRDVPLTVEDVLVPAGGAVAVWLQYTSSTVDSFARTDAEFRAQWGDAASTYPLVKATGQPGMVNGGERGIRVTGPDGAVAWTYYPAGSVSPSGTAHFAATDAPAQALFAANAPGTPGVLDPAQLAPATSPSATPTASEEPSATPTASEEPSATPTPSEEPSATPTTTEEPSATPTAADPTPDPDLDVALLQVTEVVPDTSNLDGADAFEFIEVYNPTDDSIDFSDFKINYLYPAADLTINSSALWPSEPADVVIPSGQTLVFWIKNGRNDALTAADFNAKFGTALVAGEDLVEISAGGMANGSIRGVEVITNTGVTIKRTYYNHITGVDHTQADQGIHYTGTQDKALQEILEISPATPGSVRVGEQVPTGLMPLAEDTAAPAVADTTADAITPGQDFAITHTITDDQLVRTATLHVRSNVDAEPMQYNLLRGTDDTYTFTIPAADLTGKRYYDYWVVAGDGTSETTTPSTRVALEGVNTDPVRLNVTDGEFVSGTTQLVVGTEGGNDGVSLSIDGDDVSGGLVPALEGKPVFVFEASQTDAYFQNGVLIDGEVLHVFDKGFYGDWVTVSVPVDEAHLTQGEDLTVEIWAGTKKAPEIDPDENNDDFEVRNLRLVLPDGRTLRDANFTDPGTSLRMGDSAGKYEFYEATYDVPADAFSALGYTWDTTAVADGPHDVVAVRGEDRATAEVVVDNTAPQVVPSVADGSIQKGEISIDAEVTDAGVGVESVVVRLDGEVIETPHDTSSLQLSAGEHVLEVTATDALGNRGVTTVTFTTPEEQPGVELAGPADGAEVQPGVELSAVVTDPTADELSGSFNVGHRLTAADGEVALTGGLTSDAATVERDDAATVALDQAVSSGELLPYQLLTVPVPEGAGDDYRARLSWSGEANAGQRVSMNVLTTDGGWNRVAETVTEAGDGLVPVSLEALVPAGGHEIGGELKVLIQHTDGWAGGNRTQRSDDVEAFHAEAEPRSSYDFTVAHVSDTQYYNANGAYYKHQQAINEFLVAQRDNLNLAYVAHTGDIVDNNDIPEQWERANPAYELFDDAGLPYGVLAGNHDVSQAEVDYTEYGQHFGEARFADNPWYGESHLDNRGHYDLFSAGGIDFIHVYMGWGAQTEQIEWMNEVLARYPERIAVVNLHEYMLTTGGLGALPQRIFDEVVATNPNVRMVQSGHYHDAFTRTDTFDDDGDGTAERTVTSMLFDYQGLPEGGLGYLRLQHYDNESRQLKVRTYSPSLGDFNADDDRLEPEHQSFEVSYDTLGIEPATKSLATKAFSADILTTQVIGEFTGVESGATVTAVWDEPTAGAGWYVVARDAFGGEAISEIRHLVVAEPTQTPSASPTAPPSGIPSATPSARPTAVPSATPSARPTAFPGNGPRVPYEVPGFHNVNGRWWHTECEPYSQTIRCRTSIWATSVAQAGGRFVQSNGWVFNNLSYLPYLSRAAWGTNPLAVPGEWTGADGRRWRTECETPATGRNGCRTWVEASVIASSLVDGERTFRWTKTWVFNNSVRFRN